MAKNFFNNKGQGMEELLREYFLRSGYYVLRSVPFVYDGFDVTDIDVWLYGRPSSLTREITIVDAKNKKTPQAIERIFWVQGLKLATKATNAVVATTDKRPAVKSFGKELGVLVLDGSFLGRLNKPEISRLGRITEEEFLEKINEYSLGKLDGDWKGRVLYSKSLLVRGLSFDNINEWLLHARFFAEQSLIKPKQYEVSLRCFYLVCSFIAISIDYILKDLSFLDQHERISQLKSGFTFGSKGEAGMKNIINISINLLEQYSEAGKSASGEIRRNVESHLSSLNTSMLAEYFSNSEVARSLFQVGKDLEGLAMKSLFSLHSNSSIELRSFVFCLLDYWGVDRKEFSNTASV
ncbi:MAG: hypothetical protein AB7D37_18035 [Desulfovibrio sp.]|mgnify:CR=1 FL=1